MRVLFAILVYSLAVPAWATLAPEPDETGADPKIDLGISADALKKILAGVPDKKEKKPDEEQEDAQDDGADDEATPKKDEKKEAKKEAQEEEPKLDDKQTAAVAEFSKELQDLFKGVVTGASIADTTQKLLSALSSAQKMISALTEKKERPDPKMEDEAIKKFIAEMKPAERKKLIEKLVAGTDSGPGPAARHSKPSPSAESDHMQISPLEQFKLDGYKGMRGGFASPGGCAGGRCGPSGGGGTHAYSYGGPDRGGASGMSGGFGPSGGGSRAFSGPRDPLPPSDSPFPKEDLMPAGTRGNPSFEFMAKGERKVIANGFSTTYQGCQGSPTVIDKETKTCQFVTAAHCVLTEGGHVVSEFNTADFGSFFTKEVKLMPWNGTVGNDMAIVTFKGDACVKGAERKPEPIKIVKLATEALKPGDVVFGATRYFGKMIYGTVANNNGQSVAINYDYKSASGEGHQGGIHSGDSGGGLFSFDEKGDPVLHAVLSASTKESQTHFIQGQPTVGGREAYYSTALDFARDEINNAKRVAARTKPSNEPKT